MSGIGDESRNRSMGARNAAANRSPRTCPRCLRKGGLGERLSLGDHRGAGGMRICRYCDHEVGRQDGVSFGRDVTPEPGARGGTHLPHLNDVASGTEDQ